MTICHGIPWYRNGADDHCPFIIEGWWLFFYPLSYLTLTKYKQSVAPYGEKLSEIIYLYCIGMGILNDSEAYLFPAQDKYSHVSENSVGNYYRVIREKAGISSKYSARNGRGACLHCFRHSFAVRSFDKNGRNGIKASEPVPFLSTYLGHDSLYETLALNFRPSHKRGFINL